MIFFTSDLHFGHYNVIQYCNRPFDTVEQMNEYMVEKWNEVVGPDDIVYVLGDFAMGPQENVVKYGPRLNGIKFLVPGNHDRCHEIMHKNKEQKKANGIKLFVDAGFSILPTEHSLLIAGQTVKLHHMPYRSDHTADVRYANIRPTDEGGWLLHGHVHDLWKIEGKQINVGVDVWNFLPVPITEIERIIRESQTS